MSSHKCGRDRETAEKGSIGSMLHPREELLAGLPAPPGRAAALASRPSTLVRRLRENNHAEARRTAGGAESESTPAPLGEEMIVFDVNGLHPQHLE
jgi:hypothetical protein